MKELFKFLVVNWNFATPAGERLYISAKSWLGVDASPNDRAPDELGCAETIHDIVFKTFGDYVGGDLSTYRMFHALQANDKFVRVSSPLQGDIIISPTGYGTNKKIPNGHVGIVSDNNKVMSNSSATGTFEENYTIYSWKKRYVIDGGYPVYFYRRIYG